MVFIWSYLSKGDAGYTVVQVTANDLVMLFAFQGRVILANPLAIVLVALPSSSRPT